MKGKDKSSSVGSTRGGLPSGCDPSGFALRIPGRRTVAVAECGLMIGRSRVCDVVLADEDSSRRHASFRVLGGSLWVIDEGSTNGTLVNGEAITRKRVEIGDEIVVGNTRIQIEEGDGELSAELEDDWGRFLEASLGRPGAAIDALRTLASAEDCRCDADGVVAINWAEGERGIDGLGPVRARLVEDALGILAGVKLR